MGGVHGEIRGKSKAEVYYKYVELVEQTKEMMGTCIPDPKYKKSLKKENIVMDPETGEWVLLYRLHT